MKHIKNSSFIICFFAVVLFLTYTGSAFAAALVRTHTQSDGSVVSYLEVGGGILSCLVDANGDLLVFGDDGDLYYAEWISESELKKNASSSGTATKFVVQTNRKPVGRSVNDAPLSVNDMRPLKKPIPNYIGVYVRNELSSSNMNESVPQSPRAASGGFMHMSASSANPPMPLHDYGGYGLRIPPHEQETARYTAYDDNMAKRADEFISTFGLDMSTASYANVRRFLNAGRIPILDAVRIEEMVNYFPPHRGEQRANALASSPFYVGYEIAPCPWNKENMLLWLSVETRGLNYRDAPPASLVFLVDVSGSMDSPERLPLVQASLRLLTKQLRPEDRVSIVIYASSVGVVLPSASGKDKELIRSAINSLRAGGSTAGGSAIRMAYEQAEKAFIKGGINRILLCTDGDFNVGVSDTQRLTRMVAEYRQKGVTLSVLGFGTNNLNDGMMVSIASVGNGNYSYIDSLSEAKKALDDEMAATLITVAKDVKAQIEFNPAVIGAFRQIGYEKRQLSREDFNDDRVDAGDVGAGKRVTILYELTPYGKNANDPLRYRSEKQPAPVLHSDEAAYLKLRWKEPNGDVSSLAELPIMNTPTVSFETAGEALRFSAAVAAFGQKLRGNPELSGTDWKNISIWAEAARGSDEGGYRAELVRLISLAESLAQSSRPSGRK